MKYDNATLTNAGVTLLRDLAMTKGTLTITCIRTGDGSYTKTEDLKVRKSIKKPKQEVQVTQVERDFRNQIRIASVITNEGLDSGYPITEMGVYALDQNDKEIMLAIAVCYSSEEADYMPKDDESYYASINLFSYIKVSNTTNVTTVSDTGYASLADFLITKHKVNSIAVTDDSDGNVVISLPL